VKITPFQQKIPKPWGYELILGSPNSSTTAKILHINAGCRFSLQYHEIKEETLVLIRGEAKIIYGSSENNLLEEPMEKERGYFIPKGLIHRCLAISDCDIFESSTKEVGTTVRLQDDYQRGNESEEERQRMQSSKCPPAHDMQCRAGKVQS